MRDFPSVPPVLETPRLLLRTLVDDDAAALFTVFADPEAMRYWSTVAWTDADQATRTIERDREAYRQNESVRFGVFERASATLVGCCSLHHVDHRNRRAEVGYILKRAHWGRGLMHEAMTAVVAFAFDGLALRRLEADLDPRNRPSARTVERLGFAREGLMPGRWLVDGVPSDTAFYGLLEADWRRHAAASRAVVRNRSRVDGPIVPTLIYDDVPAAVAWLCSVFGFEPCIVAGDGHAQLVVGRGGVMLGKSRSEKDAGTTFGPPAPGRVSQSLLVPVDDVEGHHARVVAAGGRVVTSPTDHAYGERQYTVLDVEGHRWTFSQSIADVDPSTWGARSFDRAT